MHSTNLPPAGKAIEVDTTQADGVYLTARIVEPTAVKLVKEGVYSAFSVGISKPRIIRDKVAKNGRVVDGVFSEVSIVDFPALPSAKFTVVKRASDEIATLEKTLTPVGTIFKRNFDRSVGGGVDRDKIPAEDFAGKNRSFPIVSPSDVADAASSIGRAGADNYSSDQLKSNIIRIAKKKGQEFVDQLPESWKDAEKAADADLEKSATECDVCKGSGKNADGGDCDKCMGKGLESDIEKSGDGECEACKGAGCEKCSGKMAEAEVEKKKKVPDIDEEISEELDEADDAIHDAQAAQAADVAGHESGTPEDEVIVPEDEDDEDDEDEMKKSLDVDLTYAVRRAHDATCAAFSHNTVETVHPSIAKNGLKSVLDPSIIQHALAASINKSAFEPEVIRDLTAAVEAATDLAGAPDGEVSAARDMIHKAFADAYPTAHPTPASVTPGQFQRPYLSTGRSPSTSTGAAPRLPYTGASTVNAGEFDRGPLTADHERPSPSSTEFPFPGNESAVDQLTAMARDHAIVSMAALHDHIQAAYPDICPLGSDLKGAPTVAGISRAGMETLSTSGDMKPLKTTAAVPAVAKSDDEIADDDMTTAHVDGAEVLLDTEVLTSIVKTIVAEQITAAVEEMQKKIDTVEADVQKMASEPDPAQAPVRGTVTVERASVTKSVTEAEIIKQRAEGEFKEQVRYLETLTKSGNPELRNRAQMQLDTLLERAVMGSVDN